MPTADAAQLDRLPRARTRAAGWSSPSTRRGLVPSSQLRGLALPSGCSPRRRSPAASAPIDAIGVARVALQEGLGSFPVAHLDGPELDLRLLVDHRERLVRSARRAQQHAAVAAARSLARARTAQQLAVLRQLGPADRQAPRQGRADDARPHRPRRAAAHPRALADHQGARGRDRRPRRQDRSAAAHRAGVRTVDGGQAGRRDRRRATVRHTGQARPRRGRRADPRQLGQHPATTPRPGRQPPDQRRASPRHRHPRPLLSNVRDTRPPPTEGDRR